MRDHADIVREFRDVLAIVECGSPSVAAHAAGRLPALATELLASSKASRLSCSSATKTYKWRVYFWLPHGLGQEPRLTATIEAPDCVSAVADIRTYYGEVELDEVELVTE